MKSLLKFILFVVLGPLLPLSMSFSSAAEDGYNLWLRYPEVHNAYRKQALSQIRSLVYLPSESARFAAAVNELRIGLDGLLGKTVATSSRIGRNALVVATRDQLAQFGIALPNDSLETIGEEGYSILSTKVNGKPVVLLVANTELGLLYGSFALLQHIQNALPLNDVHISRSPKVALRLLNHWDNLDGSVERGFAGQSLWDWWRLPDVVSPRYRDYARANAAIGINGTVLNNVNASADSLSAAYLSKTAELANVFRPYGIRVFLSARFSAPIDLGGLKTADPLNPKVQQWWQQKAKEIYSAIPDFGGFLVKANSEGQPGPQDYGRSHADGANMLAQALEPFGGVVMWRAFVYSEHNTEDRAKQAYSEFKPLDGHFASNVLLQVKNGPIDFQPREPFHPLFGAMPKTPLLLELQITKEYLGFSSHLAYLGGLYQEVLQSDTYARGKGSTLAKVVDGSLHHYPITGIAGVANIGTDRNWCGSIFDQANWFAFGRLAWNPDADAAEIAREWLQLTFTLDDAFVSKAENIMLRSREAVVDYMTPLGLAHLMATGHHYGPGPWVDDLARPEWNPTYYHRADRNGIGFDRTASGSNALAQYFPPVATNFGDLKRVDPIFLLWFHHLPWRYPMKSGRTLWQELVVHYDRGVKEVAAFQEEWRALEGYVDPERFRSISARLNVQMKEARWWRDASLAYFSHVSGLPLPPGTRLPEHDLEYYKSLKFPYAPGH